MTTNQIGVSEAVEKFFAPDIRAFVNSNNQVTDAIGVSNKGYMALIRRSAGCISLKGMDYDIFREGFENGICIEIVGANNEPG